MPEPRLSQCCRLRQCCWGIVRHLRSWGARETKSNLALAIQPLLTKLPKEGLLTCFVAGCHLCFLLASSVLLLDCVGIQQASHRKRVASCRPKPSHSRSATVPSKHAFLRHSVPPGWDKLVASKPAGRGLFGQYLAGGAWIPHHSNRPIAVPTFVFIPRVTLLLNPLC